LPRVCHASTTRPFDQYQRDIPYATLAQAFQSIVRPILAEGEAHLGRWRVDLQEALGPNGALMINLVPELELIIGEQPPVTDLSPLETQQRFQMVLRQFVAVFARKGHPLVLFLDDLQWLDARMAGFYGFERPERQCRDRTVRWS
jgi:predicted ATPase